MASTEVILQGLEKLLAEVLNTIILVADECMNRYDLTPHQEKMLRYSKERIESTWSYVDQLFAKVIEANDELFIEYDECISEEVPYKKDYSQILLIPIGLS